MACTHRRQPAEVSIKALAVSKVSTEPKGLTRKMEDNVCLSNYLSIYQSSIYLKQKPRSKSIYH